LQIGAESIPLICLLLANGTSVTAILGISAYFHDSAAALVVDGEIVAAAQEERFTRIKHDPAFPRHAVDYCLAEAGLTPGQLDFVGFYDKPLLKFERLLETCVAFAPRGFRAFAKAMPLWVKQKLHLSRDLHAGMGGQYRKRIVFPEHHESHAASAFFPSPFEEAAILTIDGVGEWATASYGVGRGHRIELLGELRFPHSLGMLYSAFTYFCGFRVNSGEYKLMGLAPYGTPRYVDAIRRELVTIREDGSLRLNLKYFDYCIGDRMTSPEFDRLFGGPPRQPESPLTEREMDLAASIQVVTEEIMLKMARHVHAQTGLPNLCLAGGVALNCVGNGRLLREGPFENLWIQPAAGDAGGALGVATFIWHQLLDQPRVPRPRDSQSGSLLGPAFDDVEIEKFLNRVQARYRRFPDDSSLCEEVSRLLSEDKVVGWVQGRMEFGPRALGARSILGDARSPRMQSVMNLKIKFRESFRPFAPSVLEDHVAEHFEVRPRESSPYMLLVAGVRDARRADAESQMAGLSGIDKLKVLRSEIPAVTHVDYSARIQTVDPERHGRYHALIEAFKRRTGCPVIINTSFNVRGEPIVCTPEDAYRCFLGTNMDALVLEHCVLLKEEQAAVDGDKVREYLDQFKLD
jgi:carbamoyltransferase